jgi:hypothetical protein
MTRNHDGFRDLLKADAQRRAGAPDRPAAANAVEHPGWSDLRFKLVNTFPRESRGVFAALRETLAPFGYSLSPLHPGTELNRPRMQTELARLGDQQGPQFAPLVFELERGTSLMRVFVRQFGGRAVPDFAERRIDLSAPVDPQALQALLEEYVSCMIRPLNARPAAA